MKILKNIIKIKIINNKNYFKKTVLENNFLKHKKIISNNPLYIYLPILGVLKNFGSFSREPKKMLILETKKVKKS